MAERKEAGLRVVWIVWERVENGEEAEMTTATAGSNRLSRTASARTKNPRGTPGARGILNFGQLSPHAHVRGRPYIYVRRRWRG